ncbi:MAG: aminoacyl-histidine dipeptidase [Lachnospiraceae bacterium]|nr:aminoacyl-histidine dipeptidase [Lachnospiraceae bacterium]
MERVLENIDYRNIFKYFEEICNIPHGSGNNKKISDYLVRFAVDRGLEYYQDEALNVIIYKPASEGMEDVPGVIIQGHMDMVCEKDSDSNHNFEEDPLELIIEDGWIKANKTTLGADDGIGVAYALAILDEKNMKHPAIEVLITTDEETGMDGAEALDGSKIKGKYLMNLDSEDEGVILSSCAGGLRTDCTMPVERQMYKGTTFNVGISGLKGGHSGTEIVNNGKNATIELARILYMCRKEADFVLFDMNGGQKDNVIPNTANARIVVADNEANKLEKLFRECASQLKAEYRSCEPDVEYTLVKLKEDNQLALTSCATDKVLRILQLVPNGVQVMSSLVDGLPESSLNLGIMKLTDDKLVTSHSVRSSVNEYKRYINEKLVMLYEQFGGNAVMRSEYPAWEYKEDSYLREVCMNVFKNMYGRNARIEAIHAGLECGILAGKIEGLDIVSFGPDMRDIHTSRERLNIESTKRVYDYIKNIIESIER